MAIQTPPANKNYREGWDRIYGSAIAKSMDKVTVPLPEHNEDAEKALQIKLDKAEDAIHKRCKSCELLPGTDYSSFELFELCTGCSLWPWRKLVRS